MPKTCSRCWPRSSGSGWPMTYPRRRHLARRDYATTEHRAVAVPAALLTHKDLDRIDRLAGDGVLTWQPTRDGYELDTHSYVGVLTLDHIRLELRPKLDISGEQLISWLGYALGFAPNRLTQARGWHTAHGGLTDLVVAALVDECRRLIRQGLRRNYLQEDHLEHVLRGRLDLQTQMTRRYGMVDRLHIRSFDRRPDIWENQVCHAALQAGARLAQDPTAARSAAETAHGFPAHPQGAPAVVGALKRESYHPMNTAYRPAPAWAALLLGGGGPADLLRAAEPQADSLLVNMDRLWEAVVRRMVGETIAETDAILATRNEHALIVTVDGRRGRALQPDVLVLYPGAAITLPIDAKYKHATSKAISSDDLHQLLTYATAYPMPPPPRGMIIQPSQTGWSRQRVTVTGPAGRLGEILVVGVDIHQHPRNAGERLRGELDRLLAW